MTNSDQVPSGSRTKSSKSAGNAAIPDKTRWFPSGSQVVPEKSTVDTLGGSPSRVGAQAPPTGNHTTTQPDPPDACGTCQSYLQTNRTRLLPHLGRTVTTTGKTPAVIIDELLTRFHKLGHPTAPRPEPSEATKALRRIAQAKRLMDGSHG